MTGVFRQEGIRTQTQSPGRTQWDGCDDRCRDRSDAQQARDPQGLMAASDAARGREEPLLRFDFGLLVSRAPREPISVVSGHPACGNLCGSPRNLTRWPTCSAPRMITAPSKILFQLDCGGSTPVGLRSVNKNLVHTYYVPGTLLGQGCDDRDRTGPHLGRLRSSAN